MQMKSNYSYFLVLPFVSLEGMNIIVFQNPILISYLVQGIKFTVSIEVLACVTLFSWVLLHLSLIT